MMQKRSEDVMKCLACEFFKEKTFFPRTGGTSGKCYNPDSPNYRKWTVGAWGCTPLKRIKEGELFNF